MIEAIIINNSLIIPLLYNDRSPNLSNFWMLWLMDLNMDFIHSCSSTTRLRSPNRNRNLLNNSDSFNNWCRDSNSPNNLHSSNNRFSMMMNFSISHKSSNNRLLNNFITWCLNNLSPHSILNNRLSHNRSIINNTIRLPCKLHINSFSLN